MKKEMKCGVKDSNPKGAETRFATQLILGLRYDRFKL
jgi:hypothetical protein